jgi:hypothetical protein
MPEIDLPHQGSALARLGSLLRTVALAAVLLVPVAIVAGSLERRVGTVVRTTPGVSPALANAVRYVRALPVKADVVALAAQGTQEGHWRFVSRSGEMLTAGTPDEMKRVVPVLYPDANAGARLALYLTQDTILRDRAALKALPAGVDLSVVVGEESYRLLRRGDAAGERWYAEVRPNLVVEVGDRRLFEEAVWQLGRRLDAARVRVLALEPGGPSRLPASPRIDPASKRALVDIVDPASLAPAMGGVAGQTLVVVGRIERDVVHVKPARGPERTLVAKDLFQAAAGADVNIVVLGAATPRQPGGRNWLWRKIEVQGLEEALRNARMADFLSALGAPGRRLSVVALPLGKRAMLDLVPTGDASGAQSQRPVDEFFAGAVAEVTGRVAVTSVQASLRSAERQEELDHRLLPGIPSALQIAYGVLVVLGLLGVPVSRLWWQRLWPPEDAGDYAGPAGYWAARATRGAAFALVFLPLTALVSAPCSLGRQVREAVTAPLRLWRRPRGRTAQPQPAASAPREPAPAANPAPGRARTVPPHSATIDDRPRVEAVPPDLGGDRPRFLRRR